MAAADCSRHAMESLICAQRVEVDDWRYASARVDVSYLTDGVQVSLTLPPNRGIMGAKLARRCCKHPGPWRHLTRQVMQ